MSSSADVNNPSCARYHQPQQNLSEPLKGCGGCRSIQYCSPECQKSDWTYHKKLCRVGGLDNTTVPCNRQTMRINLHGLERMAGGPVAEPEPDIIYYLQTSTPHLHDISVSGPYYPLHSIIPQVLHNFGDECEQGRKTFLNDIVGENGAGLASFAHLTSPVNSHPNQTRTVRLLREHNPTMAAKLPDHAWYVCETEMDTDPRLCSAGRPLEFAPVKNVIVHKTFDNEEAATREAKALAARNAALKPNGRVMEMPGFVHHELSSFNVVSGAGGSQEVISFVVRHETGEISQS